MGLALLGRAADAGAAVVFVEYDRSPEARHPVAVEQAYATAQRIVKFGAEEGLDPSRLAVAGDSVGGNMTAPLTILAEQRGDVHFVRRGPAGRPARPCRSRIPAPLRCGALLGGAICDQPIPQIRTSA
ncbi:alpha/beta hydrolase fold domain-containing protein [Nonomuraea sp. AD125B]|uniref:alpha/beta hydrolase fold domain-containing protein n=1 Tax=Nonomuraea sp. AD125B TaxID=3242897 RepID=UPI00352829B8